MEELLKTIKQINKMRIFVKAKTRSRVEFVEETGENEYTIHVHEVPEGGKANLAIIQNLAEHLGINENQLRLVAGGTSSNKVFEIK
jgi:uncharacterized protein YggU (UPF0235/DUF167 family)